MPASAGGAYLLALGQIVIPGVIGH